jgi:hypothetical protein
MIMTVTEAKIIEHDSYGTTGAAIVAVTALSASLLLAQYSRASKVFDPIHVNFDLTPGSDPGTQSAVITEVDIFSQINRVVDELLSNQVDLDVESKRALYQNLWELYT